MRFWLVLLVLGWRMRWLARNNLQFREKLEDKDLVLQFRTDDGRIARHYIVRQQAVQAVAGIDADATLTLSFKDAGYAFETIKAAAADKTVFMKGVGNKDITVTGDPQVMMWFMSLMKFLPPRRKKPAPQS